MSPLDLQVKTQIGYVHYFRHDINRAIEQFEKVLALEPTFAFAHYALGDACTQTDQYDRAFAAFEKAIELGGRSVNHVGVLGYAYGRSGNRDRAQALLRSRYPQYRRMELDDLPVIVIRIERVTSWGNLLVD